MITPYWEALTKLDSVHYLYFDKNSLAGFLTDCSLPHIDNLCFIRSVVEKEACEICGYLGVDLNTVEVALFAMGPIF